MARAYLSLGSNLGDREQALSVAIKALECTVGITVLRVADTLETKPVGYTAQGKFLNTVVEIETELSPHRLLRAVQDIEHVAGRVRSIRFGPRTLDIDILLYGQECIIEDDLVIPHPRMCEREFVLVPLSQIAPLARVPPAGDTVRDLYEQLLKRKQV
ncbi:MAG: 2-amino-4-hydroxy-6-hydroxymethyldihydropteridine pyrophosphokinase [Firmicutes bacterium]|nr:2-amino-4-hydroxy-6-hydroxymethyldihydropteridine pyrophosphokinase [candidate division NPL-UPA2 bacterium]